MNFNLVKIYRDSVARRETEAAIQRNLAAALDAVERADVDALGSILETANFNDVQIQDITIASIRKDDLDVFKLLLTKYLDGNINKCLFLHTNFRGGPNIVEFRPMLSFAIEKKSAHVALFIASDPKVNVMAQDYRGISSGLTHSRLKRDMHSSALDKAIKYGLTEVETVVAHKVATHYRQEAQNYERAARALMVSHN